MMASRERRNFFMIPSIGNSISGNLGLHAEPQIYSANSIFAMTRGICVRTHIPVATVNSPTSAMKNGATPKRPAC
jgi:hypothetical protein